MSGHDSDSTARFRAHVSERRQRIGEQVLAGVLVAAITAAAASYLTGRRAVEEMGTQLAVIRTQMTYQAAATNEKLAELKSSIDRISGDLYRPRAMGER